MSKTAKTAAAPKAAKAKPTLSAEAKQLVEKLASFDLAQLRLIEAEVLAAKRAKAAPRNAMNPATAKALDKHNALFNNVKSWLKAGAAEKVKTEGAVLPKALLQLLMKELGVEKRSAIKDKAAMLAALIATAPVAMAKAA
jgi:hypothetical protein